MVALIVQRLQCEIEVEVNAMMSSTWHYPTTFPALGHDEVHIWQVMLDVPTSLVRTIGQVLTTDEHKQAKRFRSPQDAVRFIMSRGTLRTIIGCYLEHDPAMLQFHYGPYGKPALAREADNVLRFNVTHSRDRALFAITRGREVGIDLEYIHDDMAYEQIAEHQFTRNEVHTLNAIPSSRMRRETFFRIWTRKEAFLKARGLGLSLNPQTFDVPVTPATLTPLLGTKAGCSEMSRWLLYDLPSTGDSVASLVVEGSPCSLKCWHWLGK